MSRIFYAMSFIAVVLASSCQTTKNISSSMLDNQVRSHIENNAKEYYKTSKEKNTVLLPHQVLPIEYLHERDDVHGLIVNHYLGTGKTFLAIGFAEKYPQRSIVIIAPRFIEAHWRDQIKQYGVVNPQRYRFMSYENAPAQLKNQDLSESIVIVDEAHNLVRLVRSEEVRQSDIYGDLYLRIRNGHKILALTGTPIYNNESDLAYLLNLVSNQNLVTYNSEQFRLTYSKIRPGMSFFRGHVNESLVLPFLAAGVGSLAALGLGGSFVGAMIAGPVGAFALFFPPILNLSMPLEKIRLRELDVSTLGALTSKYVSYYKFAETKLENFPSKQIIHKTIKYNETQLQFFYDFIEESLPEEYLRWMLRERSEKVPEHVLMLNSSQLQHTLKQTIGAGREVGNFTLPDGDGKMIASPKFREIVNTIKRDKVPQTVVYSNYFENGTKLLAEYLKEQGLEGSYAVLDAAFSTEEIGKIIQQYNSGRIKILLLHPEITEGISLVGTRQFHILEPVLNNTMFEQIIGRAVRYRSHAHLPEHERRVDIYLWKNSLGNIFDLKLRRIKKDNWRNRYGELSDWSLWGVGIAQIDKNYSAKRFSPDDLAQIKQERLRKDLADIGDFLRDNSIESSFGDKKAIEDAYKTSNPPVVSLKQQNNAG